MITILKTFEYFLLHHQQDYAPFADCKNEWKSLKSIESNKGNTFSP